MTPSQLTDLTTQRVPAWTDARDQMIHACALQEHIIAAGPVLPTSIRVEQIAVRPTSGQRVDVTVYLHRNAPGVEAFQRFLGGELQSESSKLDDGTDGHLVSLTGAAFGCTFRVWTLAPVVPALIGAAA